MYSFFKTIPTRTTILTILLVLTIVGVFLSYKLQDDPYIYVDEYHVYDVKTPFGDFKKETRTHRRFDPNEKMADFYLNNQPVK